MCIPSICVLIYVLFNKYIYTYTHTFTYLLKRVCNTVQFVLKSFKRKIELSNFIKNTILVHISFNFFPPAYLLVGSYITLYLFLLFSHWTSIFTLYVLHRMRIWMENALLCTCIKRINNLDCMQLNQSN